METPESPLTQSATYSGKVYRLTTTQGTLNLPTLRDQLSNKTIHLDTPSEYQEDEDLIKPDVFMQNGKIKIITTIEDVELTERGSMSALSGNIVLDETGSVVFREKRVLILDTESIRFVVFEDGDCYYMVLIAGRNLVENVLHIIAEELEGLNLSHRDHAYVRRHRPHRRSTGRRAAEHNLPGLPPVVDQQEVHLGTWVSDRTRVPRREASGVGPDAHDGYTGDWERGEGHQYFRGRARSQLLETRTTDVSDHDQGIHPTAHQYAGNGDRFQLVRFAVNSNRLQQLELTK